MRHPVPVAVLLTAAALAAPLQAQPAQMPSRAVLLEDVERSRGNVLKYLDAAPDSMLGYRPMPGVRTFAEQIEHAAGANPMIVGSAWKVPRSPGLRTDTAVYRHDKAALRVYVNQHYDVFAQLVRAATDAQLTSEAGFAGSTKTGWRWVATALEHTTWTLGQTVPYLRANRVTPPQYLPF
jgi:hypothetical protein